MILLIVRQDQVKYWELTVVSLGLFSELPLEGTSGHLMRLCQHPERIH